MATFSKRRTIINLLISNLQMINGGISTLDSTYTFQSNVFNNVFRGTKNLEAINDFPCIFAFAGPELYRYNTIGNTEGKLTVMLRCYIHGGERSQVRTNTDNLIQDIDHIIYKMRTDLENIQTIGISLVDTDQGLLDDYGIIEMKVEVLYELETI
jgi:ribosomal protein S8